MDTLHVSKDEEVTGNQRQHTYPQRLSEANYQVHASDRHTWLLHVGHHLNQREWIALCMQIELQAEARTCTRAKIRFVRHAMFYLL
ncbi:MAG: hypothetical protein E6J11_18840 [Chloroflexi bacterium]|nr:MAG: hypothetical protein E6J36_10015 [Chloroflexota bacterium]TMC92486.1 MAG: hypothetical protein E6J11_18840 [Chloroflexota bacterium]